MWWRLSAPWTSCWEKSTGKVAKEKGPVIHATLEFLRTYAGPLTAAGVIVAVAPRIAGYVLLPGCTVLAKFPGRVCWRRAGAPPLRAPARHAVHALRTRCSIH